VATVRPIRDDEIAALSEITVAAYGTLAMDVGDYRDTLADVADRVRSAMVLVAVDGDRVLGGVTYVPDATSTYAEFTDDDGAGIRMLAVDPAVRGGGVGEALVAACVAMARADGRSRVVLHTTDAMAAARRLYARLGFIRAADRDWSPQPGITLLGYELQLCDT
jgi:GNAT superfamily N-acetyltransferase